MDNGLVQKSSTLVAMIEEKQSSKLTREKERRRERNRTPASETDSRPNTGELWVKLSLLDLLSLYL